MTGRGSTNGSSSSSPNRPHHRRVPSITTAPPPNNNTNNSSSKNDDTTIASKDDARHPRASTPRPQSTAPPLLLTARFSSSIDDILLDIPHPNQTTVAALKHLIRSRLQPPDAQKRLRFIHSGKLLADNAVLGAVLKPLPPPPPAAAVPRRRDDDGKRADPKGKGKAVLGGTPPQQAQRVYVNCSIGVQLSDAELAEEKRRAEEPPPAPSAPAVPGGSQPFLRPGDVGGGIRRPSSGVGTGVAGGGEAEEGGGGGGGGGGGATTPLLSSTTESGPRGFDRLLSAGLSAAEVNQLRLSFRSLHEARNTADTMPSPDTLRDMEDAWLDNNNDAGMSTNHYTTDSTTEGGTVGAAVAGGGDEFGLPGVLDLLFKGMFIGFVWPLGAIAWLVRGDEEKIPKRMRMFVYFGFVLSLLVGTIRVIG